jgi:hypothetical protein
MLIVAEWWARWWCGSWRCIWTLPVGTMRVGSDAAVGHEVGQDPASDAPGQLDANVREDAGRLETTRLRAAFPVTVKLTRSGSIPSRLVVASAIAIGRYPPPRLGPPHTRDDDLIPGSSNLLPIDMKLLVRDVHKPAVPTFGGPDPIHGPPTFRRYAIYWSSAVPKINASGLSFNNFKASSSIGSESDMLVSRHLLVSHFAPDQLDACGTTSPHPSPGGVLHDGAHQDGRRVPHLSGAGKQPARRRSQPVGAATSSRSNAAAGAGPSAKARRRARSATA